MHLQSPVWCNIFNYCDIFYQKYKQHIPKQFNHWSMDKKVTTLVALGSTVGLLNYFSKVDEEESLKIILAMICALYVPSYEIKRYCTLEK